MANYKKSKLAPDWLPKSFTASTISQHGIDCLDVDACDVIIPASWGVYVEEKPNIRHECRTAISTLKAEGIINGLQEGMLLNNLESRKW